MITRLIKKPYAQLLLCLLVGAVQAPVSANHECCRTTSHDKCCRTTNHDGCCGTTSHDKSIRREVDAVMDSHDDLDDDVGFDIKRGVVTLHGVVDNHSERDLAYRLTEDIYGVTRVANELAVEH